MKTISLFYPNVPKSAKREVSKVLGTKWIAQGKKVLEFERMFSEMFCEGRECIAVNSGTAALHLAYILADIKQGDEVIVPVFTCVATNVPLLYMGCKIVFADIDKDMNISVEHVRKLVNEKTKAIVCVHYGGMPCDLTELTEIANDYNIPVIEDAAHAMGAEYNRKKKGLEALIASYQIGSISEYTCFSFQAVKHITTGDGGMLVLKDKEKAKIARRIRWFGIDREARQNGIWENDITEVGYKYQMNDIAATIGIEGLKTFDQTLFTRTSLLCEYWMLLMDIEEVRIIGHPIDYWKVHAAWMCTIAVKNCDRLQKKLKENNIECGKGHFRNDIYTVFGGRQKNLPNMDAIENDYLLLPLHLKMTIKDVHRVCNVIKSGW